MTPRMQPLPSPTARHLNKLQHLRQCEPIEVRNQLRRLPLRILHNRSKGKLHGLPLAVLNLQRNLLHHLHRKQDRTKLRLPGWILRRLHER